MPQRSPFAVNSGADEGRQETGFRQLLRRGTFVLLLSLGVPVLVLLAIILFLLHSAAWVDHSDQVLAQTSRVEQMLAGMHAGLRNFRQSGAESALEPYVDAKQNILRALDELEKSVSDNSSQAATARQMHVEIARWIASADSEGRPPAGPAAANFLGGGEEQIAATRGQLARFIAEERRLRQLRKSRLAQLTDLLYGALAVGALVGIPALISWLRKLLLRVTGTYREALTLAHLRTKELLVTLQSIGDAVVATDAEGRVTFLNPAAESLMEWTNAEAKSRPLTEVFHIFSEETGAVAANPIERVLREKVVVGLANHTVLRTKSGRDIPIEDSAAPIFSGSDQLVGVILVFHDVAQKREAERTLRESEERFRGLADHISQLAWMTDEHGSAIWFNCRWWEYTGSTLEEVRGYGWAKVHHPDHIERVKERFAAHLASGEEWEDTFPLRGADGEYRWFLSRARPVLDEQGRVTRWFGTNTDVTEQQSLSQQLSLAKEKAEEDARALVEAANRYRFLAENVSLQVWTARPDGGLDFANQEVVQYFGELEAGMENGWMQYVHLEDVERASVSWRDALTKGAPYETEFRLRRQDGEYRWFLSRAQAMRDSGGAIVKWFGTNTDIHDLKTAQAEAEAASRAKDNFLAALSHELRTPLTPVLMTATALRDDDRVPEDLRAELSMIERNIALEARLIDDLLDLTRITKGKLPLRPQHCDAHSLIGLALEIVRDDAQAKGILLERDLSAQLSGLTADPSRFQQVMWNLLRNAVKFTPTGGVISIRTVDELDLEGAPRLRIVVSDTGIGVEAASLERIFEPFEQAGLTGDHRFGGIGLGLAIARTIVNLHGGEIHAESEGAGRGTAFIVQLPGAVEPPHGATHEAVPPVTSASHPTAAEKKEAAVSRRLLIVEDHEATLQVLTRMLKRAGHQVTATNSVAGALAAAAANSFDLVVSDLGLPDGTGHELMEILRERYQLRGIALSGYGMEEDLERSRKSGFAVHLIKPVDISQLHRALESLD